MPPDTTPHRGFVRSPHGDIEYRELGSGPALLLLHALPASSRQFAEQMWRVAAGRRVLAMTMMGCGASDRPPQPYTQLSEFARTVAWLLDGLGIEQADLFGTHTGAIRYDGSHWSYREGRRWLPDNDVRGIAVTKEGQA